MTDIAYIKDGKGNFEMRQFNNLRLYMTLYSAIYLNCENFKMHMLNRKTKNKHKK